MEDYGDIRLKRMIENRPHAPKRAVITGGMPYGNKDLHYGHVLGMFLYADFMARFLRDRIGKDNVIFVSGTDCYGSPAMETYRKKVEEEGYTGTIEDMVTFFHERQLEDLKKFEISLNFYGASAVGEAVPFHNKVSAEIFKKLYDNGYLKRMSTLQFYDEEKKTFLNGRQVIGKCPYENCMSEKGYADECDLGHQYQPKELIDPISTLSGKRPVLKEISNYYFDLPRCLDLLKDWVERLEKTEAREFFLKEIKEFLKKPEIYIKKTEIEKYEEIRFLLPTHSLREEKSKASFVLQFEKLEDREFACDMLSENGIRYRTGKTLTPFRLTGNISWGVPVPALEDGCKGLTFYVWPESLWAPISFTRTYLSTLGKEDTWKDFWCDKDSFIYQILGEDNMYFYGPVQHAMWLCTQGKNPTLDIPNGQLNMSHLIVNKHSLFLGNKASSSGNIKPPKPNDLLKYYSVDQLRMHFLGLSIGNTSSSFTPKPFDPDAKPEDIDPVTKDGNLLYNVYNRILRTLFYTWQSKFDGVVPQMEISEQVLKDCTQTILKYEKLMFDNKFHMVMYELDSFIRNINKMWVSREKECKTEDELKSLITDTLHECKVAMVLLHPVVPSSIEKLADDLKVSMDIFDWNTINEPIYNFVADKNCYKPKFIEPKYDFFKRPDCQLGGN